MGGQRLLHCSKTQASLLSARVTWMAIGNWIGWSVFATDSFV
jgi:hypothetical protein